MSHRFPGMSPSKLEIIHMLYLEIKGKLKNHVTEFSLYDEDLKQKKTHYVLVILLHLHVFI